MGNFDQVYKRCVSLRQRPVLVFYESVGYLKTNFKEICKANILKKEKNYYEDMQSNNFWRKKGGCTIF
jgi:hypothetical protein